MSPEGTIAHYRITAKIGEGGMGAVYRATDTKLHRDVAIKVLPDLFAQDAGRMARFERESHLLASLNHPNIAAIHGVEERAIVMELVDGGTLHGPMPIEEALLIIHQLIDALEYAHEKGVVHRDLKPANIKVTPEGRVKVLDFGLAKAMAGDTATGDPRWSGDGKETFFADTDQNLMAVSVTIKPAFRVSTPQRLLYGNMFRAIRPGFYRYDVSRDGQRFLLNTYESLSTGQLNVVLNWRGGK